MADEISSKLKEFVRTKANNFHPTEILIYTTQNSMVTLGEFATKV